MSTKAPEIVTLGCRLNTLESEIMRDELGRAGDDAGDVVVVNTCAVTAEAERQARQTIRKLRRERPGARIIVTGCAAQLDPSRFDAMIEVDRVVGNIEKLNATTLLGMHDKKTVAVADIAHAHDVPHHLVNGLEGRTRAFVLVQQGCDNACTFCIIPEARGANRAAPPSQILDQVQKLVASGHCEVVLTGVDIAAYGADIGLCDDHTTGLSNIIRTLLKGAPQLRRLRLSSLDPARLDDDFLSLLGDEPRLMPHLHLSLQAAEDTILKRMKRRHCVADIERLLDRARTIRPDVTFGADLIAGFPTETDASFETTLNNIKAWNLQYLHVFPYSAREKTPASRMPQVPGNIARERARHLREAGERALERYLQTQVGRTLSVLMEKPDFGRSEGFAPVRCDPHDSSPPPSGTIATMHIKAVQNAELHGEMITKAAP